MQRLVSEDAVMLQLARSKNVVAAVAGADAASGKDSPSTLTTTTTAATAEAPAVLLIRAEPAAEGRVLNVPVVGFPYMYLGVLSEELTKAFRVSVAVFFCLCGVLSVLLVLMALMVLVADAGC
jgi:hypothetical protein